MFCGAASLFSDTAFQVALVAAVALIAFDTLDRVKT